MSATIELNKEYGFLGRCPAKGCQAIFRITVPAKFTTHSRNVNYYPGANNPAIWQTFTKAEPQFHPYNLGVECLQHRRRIEWKQIDGVLNPEHICDSRCTGAKGHSCECSCGGANHGKDYAHSC